VEPRDVIRAIAPKTADIGSAFYFHADTRARGKELGLDGFRFYIVGRGGVLGDVESDVVLSAFGYFEPSMLARMWDSARAIVPPRDAARAYLACNAELGRKVLAEVEGLAAYCEAAEAVVAAVDVGGLPQFAGVRAEPLPADVPARAIQLAVVLRELRGSTHLVAVRASGLATAVAHAIKRPDDVSLFGWAETPPVTDADRAALTRAESLTDDLLVPAFSELDAAGGAALVAGTDSMHAALTA
jgi:hypothetical protein